MQLILGNIIILALLFYITQMFIILMMHAVYDLANNDIHFCFHVVSKYSASANAKHFCKSKNTISSSI